LRAVAKDQRIAWKKQLNGTYTPVVVPNSTVEDARPNVPYGGQDVGFLVSASYSPDHRLLAAGYVYGSAQIWDTQTRTIVARLPHAAQAVAFSPDGRTLAASSGWDIQLWDVNDLLTSNGVILHSAPPRA
jgi:WD40 repeat protein